jgi:hypothetical protein
MPQPPDLLADLDFDAGQKLRIGQRVDAAGKHEVLPDEDAVSVAGVVEGLGLVVAAAPDPDHVVVGGRGRAQQDAEPLRVTRAGKESAGIQLEPLAKTGTPLTTN